MDLLEPQTNSDTDDKAPDNPDLNVGQKPDQKPAKPAAPKAFDIFSPNKTTPSASSRPIIVSHKAMAKDTTVTGNQEVLKQPSKDAVAPPPEEHRQMLDMHKKVNLQPVGDESDGARDDPEHVEYIESKKPQTSDMPATYPPEYDRPLESKQPEYHEKPQDEPKNEIVDAKPTEAEPKQPVPSAAFSAPEHADAAPATSEVPDKDELLLPAHLGGGYNEPVQDSEEQFNQFVVSHHKTARQKWLKKFGIIFVLFLLAAAVIGVVFWKMKS